MRSIITEINNVRVEVKYFKDSYGDWVVSGVYPLQDNIEEILTDEQFKELHEVVSNKEFNF